MKTKKYRDLQKINRQIDIQRHIAWLLLVIFSLCCAFAIGSVVGWGSVVIDLEHQVNDFETTENTEDLTIGCWNDINSTENEIIDIEEASTEEAQTSCFDTECENYEYLCWTNDDYINLAKICYAEAGSQGWDCMVAVGSVVLNRLKYGESWQTGDSILEVWSRSGEYTTYKNRNNIEPSEDAYYVSEFLLENGSQLPSYVLYQHGNGRAVKGTTIYKQIGTEVFSY